MRKGQRRLDGLSGNVISLYAKGMTTGDIQAHLAEIYGCDISRDTISRITDTVVEDMVTWQHRPLDAVYPVILIDASNGVNARVNNVSASAPIKSRRRAATCIAPLHIRHPRRPGDPHRAG